jgi:hypothetical protein
VQLELLALKSPSPAFDASKGADGLPARFLVFPWGSQQTALGTVICNETTLATLSAFNLSKNWDRPALDFEHSSVPGSPTYQGEPVKVAGYGTLEVVQGEGIFLNMSSWTAEGREYAAGGHYGDLSPTVKTNDRNEIVGLHSVALCRHGATPGVLFLSATITPTPTMPDPKAPQTSDELAAALIAMLGLDAAAKPADVLAALTDKLAETTKETPEDSAKMLASPAFADLAKKIDAQGAELKALSATIDETARREILNAATQAGKQVPTIAKTLPLGELRTLCAELPVTVPMEKRTPTEETLLLTSGLNSDSPAAAAVSAMTGVSAEDRKKYAGR